MKKILPIVIIIVLLILIKNNITHILNFLSNGSTLGSLEKTLTVEEKKNRYLNERLKYVKTDKFIEEEAKEKLGMLKEGEFFVIAPTGAPLDRGEIKVDTTPNWKKWWELFF